MAGPGRLEELELSSEEAERLQRAFRDERFRALFAEYAAELTDPEQRRLYEEEVTARTTAAAATRRPARCPGSWW